MEHLENEADGPIEGDDEPRDAVPEALADAILEILAHPAQYRSDPIEIAQRFTPDAIAARYEHLFERLVRGKRRPG